MIYFIIIFILWGSIILSKNYFESCTLCPRECGVNRSAGEVGFCGASSEIRVARSMLHMWEEPPISAGNGSGAIFFCGCPLRCRFCQNRKISHSFDAGKAVSTSELAEIMLSLQESGANNINFVTPTHYIPHIVSAIDKARPYLKIPTVYNSGGYEKPDVLRMLDGYIDIYLPDLKYYSSELSRDYSAAADYYHFASLSLLEMYEQTGAYTEKDGLAQKGVIVRHLVLPGARKDSMMLLDKLAELLPVQNIRLSIMGQYTPDFSDGKYKVLSRRITSFEYESVLNHAIDLGFEGFFQERSSADKKYTPDF